MSNTIIDFPPPKILYKLRDGFALYECSCGKKFKTRTNSVNNKTTKSCGCLIVLTNKTKVNSTNHGYSKHKIYHIWLTLIRPGNLKNVCDEWKFNIENFINDMFSTWQKGSVLKRIDNTKPFDKENCVWFKKGGK